MKMTGLCAWAVLPAILGLAVGQTRAADAPAAPAGPALVIKLGKRDSKGVPKRIGCTRLGGGNIDVAQPAPDTLIITMSGVAVAYPHPCGDSEAAFVFNLEQCFNISFEDKNLKSAKLYIEGRVIGLLRSHCKKGGSARVGDARAVVVAGTNELAGLAMPGSAVADGENLSINLREGPVCVPVLPGCYTLHQSFSISATHAKGICGKASSAEFAPDPALDPLWISHKEPFHGAAKKDFGFQVVIRVVPE
jgi:hypothetical protein